MIRLMRAVLAFFATAGWATTAWRGYSRDPMDRRASCLADLSSRGHYDCADDGTLRWRVPPSALRVCRLNVTDERRRLRSRSSRSALLVKLKDFRPPRPDAHTASREKNPVHKGRTGGTSSL